MSRSGLARLDDIEALAREHGWTVLREAVDVPPVGVEEAQTFGATRTIAGGRTLTFMCCYGKPVGRGWQVLRIDGKHAVVATVDSPLSHRPVLERYWPALVDLEIWLANPEGLVKLWQESGALVVSRVRR